MTLRTHQKIPEYERFSYADASSPNEAGENDSKRKSDIADQNSRMRSERTAQFSRRLHGFRITDSIRNSISRIAASATNLRSRAQFIPIFQTVPGRTSQLVLFLVNKRSKLLHSDFWRPDQKRIDTIFVSGHTNQHHADLIISDRRDTKLFSNLPLPLLDR
jgi:hypothetical protein